MKKTKEERNDNYLTKKCGVDKACIEKLANDQKEFLIAYKKLCDKYGMVLEQIDTDGAFIESELKLVYCEPELFMIDKIVEKTIEHMEDEVSL